MINHYDLIIIGGGSAGFSAAIKANKLKIKTLLVNSGLPLAGTCLNAGCIPSKRLLYAGELLEAARKDIIPGIDLEIKKQDFKKLIQSTNKLINNLKGHNEIVLDNLENVTYINGWAKFITDKEVIINDKKYRANYFIIATGSKALPPPIDNIEDVGYITHVEALKLKKLPKSLIIIGGGPLGLEFAQMFNRLGTKITLLEKNSSIFPKSDDELSTLLKQIFEKEKIKIKINVKIISAKKNKNEKVITYILNNKKMQTHAQEILIASGKTPNSENLDLKKVGIEINQKDKGIVVNQYLQTNKPHIYAIGDVAYLPKRIETTSSQEGRIAVENIFLNANKCIEYETVPYSLFTDPQFAYVGLLEKELDDKSQYDIFTTSFDDIIKAKIINQTQGIIKIIVHKKSRQIKGVQILSKNAAEIISQAMYIVKNKNTVDDILNCLPVYPTLSQAIKICISRYYS